MMKIRHFLLLISFAILAITGCTTKSAVQAPFFPNYPPSHIVIHAPKSGDINVPHTFQVSAIDANGDPLIYEFDWNGDGTHVEPTEMWAIPGAYIEIEHTWDKPGMKRVKITAMDIKRVKSKFEIHEINIRYVPKVLAKQ